MDTAKINSLYLIVTIIFVLYIFEIIISKLYYYLMENGYSFFLITKTGKRFSKWYWDTSKYRGEERRVMRSLTFQGIADAMADQWNFR